MRILRFALPAAATGAAALLLLPTKTDAWVPLGGSLNLDQRDVRVHNNFTDPDANNNTTPDPDFPGYIGAGLAIWKACVEWGSQLHGDGGGDPVEGLIGSGGANFDISWQGYHTAVGGGDDNVHSQLNGDGGGVYAFTESPISDGWRIRYYQDPWNWSDGPGDQGGSAVDLQGIAAHEYGHALGLDHTGAGGNPTMRSGTSQGDSSNQRSIAADDIAGVQGVYGVANVNKPIIDGLTRFAQNLEITGSNFHATNNEIWFTQSTAGGNGTPVKAFNIPSTGNSLITVEIPVDAGHGDVLVRVPGNGHEDLSNAWPFNPDVSGFETFCNGSDNAIFFCPCGNTGNGDSGCDNPQGTGGVKADVTVWFPAGSALIVCSGFPTMSAPAAVLLRGADREVAPGQVVFGDGLRCVADPVVRMAGTIASGGVSSHSIGHSAMAGPGTFYYQAWYRSLPQSFCDPLAAFNLSAGVVIDWP